MTGYQALKTELTTDPLARGYSTMTDAEAAASLNAADIAVTIDVPVTTVLNTLLLRGVWPKIELLSRESPTGVADHDNALGAAIALVRLVASTPEQPVQMTDATTNATVKAELAALVTNATIAQADSDAVLALASETISRATQIGWASGVSAGDVHAARAM